MRISDDEARPAGSKAQLRARPRRSPLLRASLALLIASASGCALLLDATTTPTDHCTFKGEDTSCGRCIIAHCQAPLDVCCGDASCAPTLTLVDDCAGSADADACRALPIGAPPLRTELSACVSASCAAPCNLGAPVGSSSSSGSGGAGSGVTGSSASSSHATSGGTGGNGLPSSIHWLNIDGDRAPPSLSPNHDLNIGGTFTAVGDGCATLEWDPSTRCAKGTLCFYDREINSWGVYIEFAFRDTRSGGLPSSTLSPWNATSAGASGIAWRLTGTAPALQVWITNMDPAFDGSCSALECAIHGPPDGETSPKFSQSLLFNALTKDDWGGPGTPYDFDPKNILSVQFKLTAALAFGESFSYCVEELGVVAP